MAFPKGLVFGGFGCLLMALAGLAKVFAGEASLGLLLIGFSVSLFSNMRHAYSRSTKQRLST